MTPQGERFLLVIMIGLLIVAVMFALSGCVGSREQPPCPDCWLYVPKAQPSRL